MRRIRKFWRLSAADRWLLLKAVVLVCSIRAGLCLLPLGPVRRLLKGATQQGAARRGGGPSKDRIVWAMATAQRLVPRATCLSQALAAEVLLERSGYPADVLIGVAKTEKERLEAHAWVESEGQVVVGDLAGLSRYARLPTLPAEGR